MQRKLSNGSDNILRALNNKCLAWKFKTMLQLLTERQYTQNYKRTKEYVHAYMHTFHADV